MHHIYHTEGLILGSKNYGEAGRYFHIFTRDLGMLYASAQGVRKISSKLRFIMQDLAYVKIDLVEGRDFWRVTSASKTGLLEDSLKRKDTLRIFSNIARLLRRLLAGMEPDAVLFDDLVKGLEVMEGTHSSQLESIEAVIVLRMLYHLGYIGGDRQLLDLAQSPFERDLVYEASKNRKDVLRGINKALRETDL